MTQTRAARITQALAAGQVQIPGWQAQDVAVSPIGNGESYDIFRLSAASPPGQLSPPDLTLRLARRPDLPRPITREFDNLLRVSALAPGHAPRPWTVDASCDNPLGAPYLVVDFVPGRVLPPQQWDGALLGAHARRLAALHSAVAPAAAAAPRPSGVEWWRASLQYWRREHPELLTDADLLQRAARFVSDREPDFAGAHVAALIHGDAVATNVVVGPDGTPRLVDWEWSEVGDVARDLALIGGFSTGGPWYVPLDDDARANLVHTYASARGLDRPAQAALARRRDVWEVLDRLFTGYWFALQPSKRAAAAQMHAGVREFLARQG